MYHLHKTCRACGHESLIPVFDFGLQPLANDFVKPGEELAGFAPLKVLLCPRCNLAQLSVVVRPDILYSHYCYRTSPSQMMLDHFEKLAALLKAESNFGRILEIGSNDGRLLKYLKEAGAAGIEGIDPAKNLADEAKRNGVPTLCAMFNDVAARFANPADVVIARHVFCHIDDWRGFMEYLELVTHKDSLVCIEVPWVQKTLDNLEFDTIYHEHRSYFSLCAMQALLKDSAFYIQKVLQFPIHGGALLVMLRRRNGGGAVDPSVVDLSAQERCGEGRWRAFSTKVDHLMFNLKVKMRVLRGEGKSVAAYGASAKSTVLINVCHFSKDDICWIADCTSEKQGCLSPGSDIPVVDEGALLRELPDYALMCCWNYEAEVVKKNAPYLERGGHFIVPVPEVRIV